MSRVGLNLSTCDLLDVLHSSGNGREERVIRHVEPTLAFRLVPILTEAATKRPRVRRSSHRLRTVVGSPTMGNTSRILPSSPDLVRHLR